MYTEEALGAGQKRSNFKNIYWKRKNKATTVEAAATETIF